MKLITCGLFVACFTSVVTAQDPLRADQYRALKNLPEVTVLVHQPNDSEAINRLIATLSLDAKSLSNVVTITLSKAVPNLRLADKFQNDLPYLEMSWYGGASALSFSLNVWRWTRIADANESAFIPVWREEKLMINPDRQSIRNTLDDFATALAADYIRANR